MVEASMARPYREQIRQINQGMKMSLNLGTFVEPGMVASTAHGRFIFDMRDAKTGQSMVYFEENNCLTLDCGILAARLFRNSLEPVAGTSTNKGLTMLSIGTGATGNLLSPDAPQPEQRKLNNQVCRKAFSSAQFRDANGVAVSYPTNVVDFTTTFSESEANGPLNEMGVVATYSSNAAVANWIDNGPGTLTPVYDPTIDVSAKDLLANMLTFGCIVKPATAILTITWRLSF
jgi:hypothetical protein